MKQASADKDKQKRKVAVIDDSPTNLSLVKVYLERMGLAPLLAQSGEQGIALVLDQQPDLILLDIMMPYVDGYEVCRRLKSDTRTSAIPIIFISAKDKTADKIAGLKLGATDYITKPFDPGELEARIRIILRMIELQEKLVTQANTDELTGLANRRYFSEMLERELLQAKSAATALSLVMLDLDHFKAINDTYGHLGGDAILRQLARTLTENIHPLDIAARYGGEEFVIVLPNTSSEKALHAIERIRVLVEDCHWSISAENVPVTISAGVTTMEIQEQLGPEELVKRADTALYYAKQHGRNQVICWTQIDSNQQAVQLQKHDVTALQSQISLLTQQLHQQTIGSIAALAKALEARDGYVTRHSENVQIYANAIAEELGLSDGIKEQLNVAAQLHDIGKISIPDSILSKPGDITEQERHIIQQHPLVGVQILEPIGIFRGELQIIRHHHEQFDGTGYPDGLEGKQIPFGARVLAVADTFDAITSERAYHQARRLEEATDEIARCSSRQLDPEVVNAFIRAAEKHADQWPLAIQEFATC